ncbi:MAG: hypothetical protein J6M58_02215 [Clostridium sp.]|nr:hypothetical protein [Clostridium sp.]
MRITENGRKYKASGRCKCAKAQKVSEKASPTEIKIPPGWGGTFGGSLLSIIAHVPGGISYDSSWYGYR